MVTSSKLGYFVLDPYDGLIEELAATKPRVVKAGDPGFLHNLYNVLGDNTIYIARNFAEIDDMARWDSGRILTNPVGAAKYWVDAFRPAMQQAPFAYWESFNEMSNWDWMPQYGLFEAERQRLMAEEGYKACIGNFSTGSPPIKPDTNDPWKYFYPALAAADRYENMLGLHEYGGLWMDLFFGPNQRDALLSGQRFPFPTTHEEGWLFGRYRKVWNTHILPNGYTSVRIVLTELGLDRAGTDVIDKIVGYPVGPWKQCQAYWSQHDHRPDGATYFAEQLKWADSQMKQDYYMVGCTIFDRGTHSDVWDQWNVQGEVARQLDNYIMANQSPSNTKVVLPKRGLYMRVRPDGIVINVLGHGELVEVISEKDGWSYVREPSSLTGYVKSVWLK